MNMKTIPSTPRRAFFLAVASILLPGCASTQKALEHKEMLVQTRTSATLSLDIEKQLSRTIFIDVKNTSDSDVNIQSIIQRKLQARKYTITDTPQEAFYILQVNVLQAGQTDSPALRESLNAGWSGPVAGATPGEAVGRVSQNASSSGGYGSAISSLAGDAAELVAGRLARDVTFAIIADVEIREKNAPPNPDLTTATNAPPTGSSERPRTKYQTRVVTSALQSKLTLDKALPVLEEKLATAIAGIF